VVVRTHVNRWGREVTVREPIWVATKLQHLIGTRHWFAVLHPRMPLARCRRQGGVFFVLGPAATKADHQATAAIVHRLPRIALGKVRENVIARLV
jgi:hypothetical protein